MPASAIYSCDDHLDLWNLPADLWQGRLPAALRARGPRVVEQAGSDWWVCDGAIMGPHGTRSPMLCDLSAITRAGIDDDGSRAATPALRLADMDRDGIHASVIYGPNLLGLPIADPALKAAALAAWNDWAREFNAHAPERLCVLAVVPTHDPAAAVAELERAAALGHRGAIVNPFELRLGDPAWEPLWAAAEASGLPISFHIGGGITALAPMPGSWQLAAWAAVAPLQLDEPLAAMVFAGPLERHPGLRLVLAESGIGWLPWLLERLDQEFDKHAAQARDHRLRTRPSELFRRQVLATFEEEPLGRTLIPLVGAGSCMWASDYPHPDSTFPHSRDAIATAFAGLPPAVIEQVTRENCRRLYRFA